MKKLRTAFGILSAALLVFAGCSDGDDSSDNNEIIDNPSEPTDPSMPTDPSDTSSGGYIGSVEPGGELKVGSVIFTDGSSEPVGSYKSNADGTGVETVSLTESQKSKAIAVIFYKGSETDALGAKTLGVGLKILDPDENAAEGSYVPFCREPANAFSEKIDTILSTASGDYGDGFTFTGDTDGSDNFEAIKTWLTDNNKTDDVEVTNVVNVQSCNYPVFYSAKNYSTEIFERLNGTNYADKWYVPTAAEMNQFAVNYETVSNSFTESGKTIPNGDFITSSQSESTDVRAGGSNYATNNSEVLSIRIMHSSVALTTEWSFTPCEKNVQDKKACFIRAF